MRGKATLRVSGAELEYSVTQVDYGLSVEKTLQALLKQQRTKVEEIKKKTNYYTTRELLQRYDEGSPSNSPLSKGRTQPVTPQRPPPPSQLQTPMSIPNRECRVFDRSVSNGHLAKVPPPPPAHPGSSGTTSSRTPC